MAARNKAGFPPRRGWRALRWFWGVVLLAGAAGGGTLQYLGPPQVAAEHSAPIAKRPAAAAPAAEKPAPPAAKFVANPPIKPPNARISAPDPALLAPAPATPGSFLPRIGADGALPMRVYAAGYDPADTRPRVAVLLANIGVSGQDSEEAINALPSAVSLAISPYAPRPGRLLELARATGHEFLIGIPMEPQGYSMNDPGPAALMTSLSPAENAARLEHALSQITGYVGATGAMGNGLHGERYAASAQFVPTLEELAGRGLLYIDPRPGATLPSLRPGQHLASRAVDLVLDSPPVRVEVQARLAQLEQLAREHGSALGLAGAPSPVVTGQVAIWAAGLSQRGIVLVPVSALIPLPPAQQARP